jgi:hypothetical protein
MMYVAQFAKVEQRLQQEEQERLERLKNIPEQPVPNSLHEQTQQQQQQQEHVGSTSVEDTQNLLNGNDEHHDPDQVIEDDSSDSTLDGLQDREDLTENENLNDKELEGRDGNVPEGKENEQELTEKLDENANKDYFDSMSQAYLGSLPLINEERRAKESLEETLSSDFPTQQTPLHDQKATSDIPNTQPTEGEHPDDLTEAEQLVHDLTVDPDHPDNHLTEDELLRQLLGTEEEDKEHHEESVTRGEPAVEKEVNTQHTENPTTENELSKEIANYNHDEQQHESQNPDDEELLEEDAVPEHHHQQETSRESEPVTYRQELYMTSEEEPYQQRLRPEGTESIDLHTPVETVMREERRDVLISRDEQRHHCSEPKGKNNGLQTSSAVLERENGPSVNATKSSNDWYKFVLAVLAVYSALLLKNYW